MSNDHFLLRPAARNTTAIRDLLFEILKNPKPNSNDIELIKALKSQGGLASLKRTHNCTDGHKIHLSATSLNTLKAYADNILPNGFKELDELRVRALHHLTRPQPNSPHGNKNTKSGLLARNATLERELTSHKKAIYILLQGLTSALTDFNNIRDAENGSLRTKRAADAKSALVAILGMAHVEPAIASSSEAGTVIRMDMFRDKP
jgi:hypothetical protein